MEGSILFHHFYSPPLGPKIWGGIEKKRLFVIVGDEFDGEAAAPAAA